MGAGVIVADTNLVAYSVIPGARDAEVRRVRAADRKWLVPPLLVSELLNVIARHIRHSKMDRDEGVKTFRRALSFIEVSDRAVDAVAVLNLCQVTGCSSYDAEFVWLAREVGVPLVTADEELLGLFPDTAVSFTGFVKP